LGYIGIIGWLSYPMIHGNIGISWYTYIYILYIYIIGDSQNPWKYIIIYPWLMGNQFLTSPFVKGWHVGLVWHSLGWAKLLGHLHPKEPHADTRRKISPWGYCSVW
jgi:hypothetical protein